MRLVCDSAVSREKFAQGSSVALKTLFYVDSVIIGCVL
jgi:hypothetical protein